MSETITRVNHPGAEAPSPTANPSANELAGGRPAIIKRIPGGRVVHRVSF